MRTRSKPLSPSSYVSLDDIPRRRRATRSASAQPQDQDIQEAQTIESKPALTAPKTRGRKKAPSTRGRKKSVRHSTKPVTAETEQHNGDSAGSASGEPAGNGLSTGQSQATEVYEPTVNSFDETASVLPSVEPNEIDDVEVSGDADNCELQSFFPQNSPTGLLFSQRSPVGFSPALKFCRSPSYGVSCPRSPSPSGTLHVHSTTKQLASSQLRPGLTNFGESTSDWMNSDSVITPNSPTLKPHSFQLEACLGEPDDRLTQEELLWCMTEPVLPEAPRTGFPYIPPGGSMSRSQSSLKDGETQWERDNRELDRMFEKEAECRRNTLENLKRKRQEELDLKEERERSCRRRPIAKDLDETFSHLHGSETSDEGKDCFYDAKDSSPELETRSSELEARLGDTEMSEGVENRLYDSEHLSLELETRSSELETRSNESDIYSSYSQPFSSGPASSVGEPETTSHETTIPSKRPGLFRRIANFTRRVSRYPKFRSLPSSFRAPRWTFASPRSPCDGYVIRYSNLDNLLMNAPSQTDIKWAPLGPQRKFPKAKAYDILSPSHSPSSPNRVEKSIKTTPIRRTRQSYAAISRRRRSEASGRIDRTLYRLPELLSQNEADGGVSDSTNLTTRPLPQASTPMTNPGAASLHLTHDALVTGSPSKQGNASTEVNASANSHQTESPSSPGFVKWAFNQVSRRWTNIRDRYAGSTPATAESHAPHSENTPTTPSQSTLSTVPNTDGPSSKARALTSAASPTNRLTRSVSLYSSGLDPELKAHCYGRQGSKKPSEKRKREVTPPSPVLTSKPKTRGFCLDDDFFTYTEEEYAAQELYEAEQRKRQAEEAENAEAGAPSAKKIKVDPPKKPTRRQPAKNRSPTKRSSATLSPSQQPGFRPNSRSTYAVPDLETIDSSRLMSEADLSQSSPHPHDRPQTSAKLNTALPGLSHESNGESPVPEPFDLSLPSPPYREGPIKITNPSGTFEVPYSSSPPSSPPGSSTEEPNQDNEFIQNPGADFHTQALGSLHQGPQTHSQASQAATPQSNSLQVDPAEEERRRIAERSFAEKDNIDAEKEKTRLENEKLNNTGRWTNSYPGFNPRNLEYLRKKRMELYARCKAQRESENTVHSDLLSGPRISGEDDLLPPNFVETGSRQDSSQIARNHPGDLPAPISPAPDPLDDPPDAVVTFNPNGTLADDENTAAEPEDESPLTRARTKAEQFKPKTPSRLREAHRFSSSMTRTSPFSQPDINSPTIDRQEISLLQQDATSQAPGLQEDEHPPAFRTLEEIKEVCDADWLLKQCPTGDLRQLKWPKKISLVDQLRSHGVHLTPEELAEADESWNDPERRKMEMDAMRTVWATAARKPLGAPVDWSAWNSLPQ